MHRYRVVIMLVLFGVLPVVAVFFLALTYLGEPEPEPVQAEAKSVVEEELPPRTAPSRRETHRVLVASRALPVGTLLGEEDFTEIEVDPGAIGKEHDLVPEEAVGHPLRRLRGSRGNGRRGTAHPACDRWTASTADSSRRCSNPASRAVTIQVGPATSHAGFVDPGDRVDVILSAELATRWAGSERARDHDRRRRTRGGD